MKYAAVLAAVAGAVSAQSVDGAAATSALLAALPTSLLTVAPTCLPVAIYQDIVNPTGLPAWFTGLPASVQSYFAAQPTPSPVSGCSQPTVTAVVSNSSVAGNLTVLTTSTPLLNGSTTVTTTGRSTGSSSSRSSSSSSSSSSGIAALPTAVIGSGILGAMGVIGMLAL